MHVVVSNHAVHRFQQRFRLMFPKYTGDREGTRSIITAQILKAEPLNSWKASPFYVNKMRLKYGFLPDLYTKDGVFYVCRVDGGRLHVLTCTQALVIYKGKFLKGQRIS